MPLGARDWKLCGYSGCREERAPDADDLLRARIWLLGFKSDPLKIGGLRLILKRELGRDASRMSNDDVVDSIAALLASGRLHVHSEVVERLPVIEGVKAPPRPERPAPRAAAPSSRPAAIPPTFPPNVNLSSQAATLVAAAADGAPFCPL